MGKKITYTCDSCNSEINFPNSKNYENYDQTVAAGIEIEIDFRGLHHGCSNSATGIWGGETTMLLCKKCRQRYFSALKSLFPKLFKTN